MGKKIIGLIISLLAITCGAVYCLQIAADGGSGEETVAGVGFPTEQESLSESENVKETEESQTKETEESETEEGYDTITSKGKIKNYSGVVVLDKNAYELFTYREECAKVYAKTVNNVSKKLKGKANVYDILVPLSSGVIFPDNRIDDVNSTDQNEAINNIYGFIDDDVNKIKVYDNLTNQYLAVNEGKLFMYLNDEITFSATPDVHATIHSLSFTSSNEEILSIDNQGKLIPHKIGQVDITLKDAYSSKVNEVIHVTIYNQILINEDQPISVSGYEAVYNEEKEQYEIMNGYSGKIKLLFLDDSTYTKVSYRSSDEKILEVGQDGTLTPHKKGVATITLVVDDGDLVAKSCQTLTIPWTVAHLTPLSMGFPR